MSKATYNITNDKLSFYHEEIGRLPADQYQIARRLGFIFWRGTKRFVAKWSPEAEDFIKSYGLTIEADDVLDDVESRVERFEKYAEGAEKSAEYAQERAASANTTRQAKTAENSLSANLDKAEHWHRRIAGAIRNAEYKDRPDVIVRRIQGLEKDLRIQGKYFGKKDSIQQSDGEYFWISAGGRGGSWVKASNLPKLQERAQRWIDHINARLEYEREYLEAVGGDPREKVAEIKIGDIVLYKGEECEVVNVGKKNVRILIPSHHWNKYGRLVGREDLGEIVGNKEPEPKAKKESPSDGIKKGVLVTWTHNDYINGSKEYTSKVISAGNNNIRVELPDCPDFRYAIEHGRKDTVVPRRYVKLAEVK